MLDIRAGIWRIARISTRGPGAGCKPRMRGRPQLQLLHSGLCRSPDPRQPPHRKRHPCIRGSGRAGHGRQLQLQLPADFGDQEDDAWIGISSQLHLVAFLGPDFQRGECGWGRGSPTPSIVRTIMGTRRTTRGSGSSSATRTRFLPFGTTTPSGLSRADWWRDGELPASRLCKPDSPYRLRIAATTRSPAGHIRAMAAPTVRTCWAPVQTYDPRNANL